MLDSIDNCGAARQQRCRLRSLAPLREKLSSDAPRPCLASNLHRATREGCRPEFRWLAPLQRRGSVRFTGYRVPPCPTKAAICDDSPVHRTAVALWLDRARQIDLVSGWYSGDGMTARQFLMRSFVIVTRLHARYSRFRCVTPWTAPWAC